MYSLPYLSRVHLFYSEILSPAKVDALLGAIEQQVPTGFLSAREMIQMPKCKISTGSRELDAILEGGIETGSITQIYGAAGSGKTQICHTLAVTSQLSFDRGGAEGKVLYIYTNKGFRPERLRPIATRYNLDPAIVLENIDCAQAMNTDHQTALLSLAEGMMAGTRYATLIVDSAMGVSINKYFIPFTPKTSTKNSQNN